MNVVISFGLGMLIGAVIYVNSKLKNIGIL